MPQRPRRTIEDEPFEMDVTDLLTSAAVQHEMDHLDGILVIDRVSRQQRRQALRRAGVAA
jgi:peptide deformylase